MTESGLNRYRKEHFFKAWVLGELKDPGTISMQAALTNVRLSSRYSVAVTALVDSHKPNTSGASGKYLEDNRIHYFESTTHLVMLLSEGYSSQGGEPYDELWENLHQEHNQSQMQIGISALSETEHMHKAYCDALEALELGEVVTPAQRIVRYDQLGVYPLLRLLSNQEQAKDTLLSILEPLLQYDTSHQSRLLYTLETYLQCGANAKETAKTMFCHYNSINNRLERIQQLLGVQLKDPETQFHLNLALRIKRLLEYRRK